MSPQNGLLQTPPVKDSEKKSVQLGEFDFKWTGLFQSNSALEKSTLIHPLCNILVTSIGTDFTN